MDKENADIRKKTRIILSGRDRFGRPISGRRGAFDDPNKEKDPYRESGGDSEEFSQNKKGGGDKKNVFNKLEGDDSDKEKIERGNVLEFKKGKKVIPPTELHKNNLSAENQALEDFQRLYEQSLKNKKLFRDKKMSKMDELDQMIFSDQLNDSKPPTKESLRSMLVDTPERPEIPYAIFGITITKDVFEIMLTVASAGILYIVVYLAGIFFSLITFPVIFSWLMSKRQVWSEGAGGNFMNVGKKWFGGNSDVKKDDILSKMFKKVGQDQIPVWNLMFHQTLFVWQVYSREKNRYLKLKAIRDKYGDMFKRDPKAFAEFIKNKDKVEKDLAA